VEYDAALIDDLRLLIDPNAPPAVDVVDLAGVPTIDEAQFVLREHFAIPGAASAVTVRVGATTVGVVTRRGLAEFEGTAAGDGGAVAYQVGAGERAGLPGRSTRFRLLRFACSDAKCDSEAYRIHYDLDDLPRCPQSHGVMGLDR
jgi:hypothetical protein